MDTVRKAIRLADRCLARNCLNQKRPIDNGTSGDRSALVNIGQRKLDVSLKRRCIERIALISGNMGPKRSL